jgi:hypothetical protein
MMILALSKATQQRIEMITVALIVCLLIFELVRRKHLMERYAVLWLTAGVTVLILSIWTSLLTKLSRAAGISYLPSAVFAVAFLFVLMMLVHFSMTISRLSHQNTMLAQRLALLQQRLDNQEQEPGRHHSSGDSGGNSTEVRSKQDT